MSIPYHDWIAHHAARTPEKVAAVDLATDRHLTYRELDARIARLASHLRDVGHVVPGDRVAVLGHTSTDTFELQFACFRIGAIFVPLNWRLAVTELHTIIADCAPRVIIHDAEFAAIAQELRDAVPSIAVWPRGLEESVDGRAGTAAGSLTPPNRTTHDDVSTILYTSGTTGRPKGVMVTHGMTVWNAVNATAPAGISSATVFLCTLPLFHTAGLNVFANPVFHSGGTVVVMPSYDPEQALRLIGDPRIGITHFYGVPAHYQFMAQLPGFAATDVSRLVSAGVGSAPAPLALIEAWQSRGVALWQTYGMTETGVQTMLNKADARRKLGSSGQPVLHTETRIVRPDGTEAAIGEIGDIWSRGPNVTPGYWNQPALTNASFTDGWLHTGDAALVDAEGFIFVVDRWKDMYISGGENVYPAEVENVLYQLPAVAEAAVIGVPDPRWGEVGRAVVAVKPGHQLTDAEVLAHCAANLGRYKLPRSVVFIDALPRNATGKVHKPTLRAQWGARAETQG